MDPLFAQRSACRYKNKAMNNTASSHATTTLDAHSTTWWAPSLHPVAERFDSWIVDQWGVLHNGVVAYPGAANALRQLVQRGNAVVVLSNSGKRSASNVERLARYGFDSSCYTALITSGEIAHDVLAQRASNTTGTPAWGTRCWMISNDGDTSVLDGLPIEIEPSTGQADFLLLCGVGDAKAEDHFDPDFTRAIARNLPMICANPDFVRLSATGLQPSCGALAKRYEALGGTVRWLGKPYPEMFRACLTMIRACGGHATAVIGDSLDHDVAGGQAAGLSTVFLTGGIHQKAFAQATQPDALLRGLCAQAGLQALPDVTMATLKW